MFLRFFLKYNLIVIGQSQFALRNILHILLGLCIGLVILKFLLPCRLILKLHLQLFLLSGVLLIFLIAFTIWTDIAAANTTRIMLIQILPALLFRFDFLFFAAIPVPHFLHLCSNLQFT